MTSSEDQQFPMLKNTQPHGHLMGNNVKSTLTGYMRFYTWSLFLELAVMRNLKMRTSKWEVAWSLFLELATVDGRFFLFKWGLTCCQRGRHFDLLWGRAINLSKNSISHYFSLSGNEKLKMRNSKCLGLVPIS